MMTASLLIESGQKQLLTGFCFDNATHVTKDVSYIMMTAFQGVDVDIQICFHEY